MASVIWILRFLIVWQYSRPVTCQDRVRSKYAYTQVNETVRFPIEIPEEKKNEPFYIEQVEPPTKKRLLLFRHRDTGDELVVDDEKLKDRVTVMLSGLTLWVTLIEVRHEESGVYRCIHAVPDVGAFENCGIVLVVLGRPSRPNIEVRGVPLVGQKIRLTCKHFPVMEPFETSYEHSVEWKLVTDNIQNPQEGFIEKKEYVIPKILKRYSGTQFICFTRYRIPYYSPGDQLQSDPSYKYYLKVQYGPEKENMIFEPGIEDGETIVRRDGEVLKVTCSVDCEPPCYTYWSHRPLNVESYTNLSMRDSDILRINVNRKTAGIYLCLGYNKHENASKNFTLETHYMNDVTISVNDVAEDVVEVLEKQPAELKCTTIADPSPVLTLKSQSATLVTSAELTPEETDGQDGFVNKKYTIKHTVQPIECDSPTHYSCEAKQGNTVVEKNISMAILCDIVKAEIPGIDLQSQYTFEKDTNVAVDFVLRASPEPKVTSVTTSLKGTTKELVEGTDYDLKVSKYGVKSYLTRYAFESLNTLSLSDSGMEFTFEFQAAKFKKSLSFTVVVTSGGKVPAITSPIGPDVTNAGDSRSKITARKITEHPNKPDDLEEPEQKSMSVAPILVVTMIIVILIVLPAFYFLVITKRTSFARARKASTRASVPNVPEDIPLSAKTSSKYDV